MRVRSVAVGVVLSLLVATAASAQLGLGVLAATAMLTTKSTKLKKVVNKLELDLSPFDYSGDEIALAGGVVVTDADGVGPTKAPFSSLTVEMFQRNADGSTESLGRADVGWGEIVIPDVDPADLGIPDGLPVGLVVVMTPPPPSGATNFLELTAKGGANVPKDFGIVPIALGVDVSALGGVADPLAARAIVAQFLHAADQAVSPRGGGGLAGTIIPR